MTESTQAAKDNMRAPTTAPVGRFAFDSAQMRPADRRDGLREAVCGAFLPLNIEHHESADRIAARGIGGKVGSLSVLTAVSTPLTLSRTGRMTKDETEPCVVLGLQVSGRRTIEQAGRRAVIRPGDLYFFDSIRPYVSANPEGTSQHCVRIPRSVLALPDRVLDRITAVRLGPEHPVADLTSSYLARLAHHQATTGSACTQALEVTSIEMIRALASIPLGEDSGARAEMDGSLALRILDYARTHLADPDLSAAQIARAQSISVRHLYSTLAKSGIGLSEWIRSERLEHCRRDLRRGAEGSRTIAHIATRWGFSDVTTFGRCFRKAYGMSPGQWRALHCDSPRLRSVR